MAARSSIRLDSADTRRDDGPRRTILQIVAPGEVGGLESVVLALSAGQTRRGHSVIVAVVSEPSNGQHPFVTALQKAGVRTEEFRLPSRAYLKERALIKQLCERISPDVVHTHGYRPDILHAATRMARNFATVTTLHGSSRIGGSSTLHEMIQLVLLRRFDAVIAVSRLLADELRGAWVRPERLHVVPNGLSDEKPISSREEARRELGLPMTGAVIGWVGRLIPIKGADVFLRAVRRLSALPITVSVVGDGPERANLETIVRAQGLSDRVRFHGVVPDAGRLLTAFDVFVLSSRSEGTPITLLEAIAARVPVVVTSVGGVPDVVGPGEGMIVAPDDPERLAAAIDLVIRDPEAAALRATAASRHLVANFGMDRWMDAHERVYDLAISNRTSATR
ncbi:MAG TPA: glycosyltransferase [Gemmatimonadaceae bacterium]|nr:glycosyltransferase [Gemmatimonadaceae bacterium]